MTEPVRPRSRGRRLAVLLVMAVACAPLLGCSGEPTVGPRFQPSPPPAVGTVPDGVLVTPTGVVAPILARFPGGAWVRTPCYSMAPARGRVVERADVVLDPGHGGPERGARGPNGMDEREPNFAIAQRVARELEAGPPGEGGVSVFLTHPDEYFVSLHTRGEIAVALHPKAFVSIHHNGVEGEQRGRRGRPGTETFHQYASPASRVLAQLLWDDITASLSVYDVEWVADDVTIGPKTRVGDHGDYYGMLRYSAGVPGVIVEASYTSNPPEAELQRNAGYRVVESDAIVRAIRTFLASGIDNDLPPSPAAPPTTASPNPPEPPGRSEDAVNCVDPPLE